MKLPILENGGIWQKSWEPQKVFPNWFFPGKKKEIEIKHVVCTMKIMASNVLVKLVNGFLPLFLRVLQTNI